MANDRKTPPAPLDFSEDAEISQPYHYLPMLEELQAKLNEVLEWANETIADLQKRLAELERKEKTGELHGQRGPAGPPGPPGQTIEIGSAPPHVVPGRQPPEIVPGRPDMPEAPKIVCKQSPALRAGSLLGPAQLLPRGTSDG